MRAGRHGGRALAGLMAVVFGLLVPVLTAVRYAGPAQAAGTDHGGTTHGSRSAPCTAAGATIDPYPYAKDITATIDGITPTVVGSTSGNLLTVTGVMTNSTSGPIYDLRYVFQRGEALSSVAAIKTEIASPGRPDAVVGQNWKILGPKSVTAAPSSGGSASGGTASGSSAGAGQTEVSMSARTRVRFTATVPISSADGLIVGARGVYPLMIKVSGDVGTNGCVQYERVGEFHLLATVLSVPAPVETSPTGPPSTTGSGVTGNRAGTNAGSTGTNGANAGSTGTTGATAGSPSAPGSTGGTDGPPPALPGQAAGTTPSTDIPTQGFPTTAASPTPDPQTVDAQTTAVQSTAAATAAATKAPTTAPPTPATSPAPAPAGTTGNRAPTPLNLIWPIVDTPHVGVSGIFLDDDLATSISPGGRLYKVLSALRQIGSGQPTTIVVDPELLAEIQQMAGGYRVKSVKGPPQVALTATTPSRTPTIAPAVSGASVDTAGTVATSPDTTNPAPRSNRPPTAEQSVPVPPRKATSPGRPPPRTTGPRATGGPAAPPPRTSTTTAGAAPTSTPADTTPTHTPTPTPTAPIAPTSTTTTAPALTPADVTVAGQGQTAAVAYLAALRTAVADRQVLVLPYSDPDTVAMVRAGLGKQLSSLVGQGREVAAAVLGIGAITAPGQPGLITTMSMPEGGVVDDATLAMLSTDGMTQALLSPSTLQHAGGPVGALTIDETGHGGQAVDAAVTDSDAVPLVDALVAKGRSAGLAVRLNTLAAMLAGAHFAGSATPLILTRSDRWTPNVAGLQVLTGLLQTMESGGVVTGGSLPAIAGSAKSGATVDYPDGAQRKELDPGYLAAVGHDLTWLHGVQGSLAQTNADLALDPAALLDPLSAAMATTMSAGLRPNSHNGRSILRTTEDTLGPLRDQVKIATGTSYTLAASTSPLLINVRNDLPYVVTVRVVVLNAQTVGMTAKDPGALSIPAGQSRQFKIATKVVKAGKFPVQVQLLAADGSSWSDPQTITVRSSAYGTLTVILIIVAGGALFLMVAIRIVQRIRGSGGSQDNTGGVADPVMAGNPVEPRASTGDAVNPPGGSLTGGNPAGGSPTGGSGADDSPTGGSGADDGGADDTGGEDSR